MATNTTEPSIFDRMADMAAEEMEDLMIALVTRKRRLPSTPWELLDDETGEVKELF